MLFDEDTDDHDGESNDKVCIEADHGPLLPKYVYDISRDIDEAAYDSIVNIKPDGFCSFNTLAYQFLDDQDEFMDIKFAMRDWLADIKDGYTQYLTLKFRRFHYFFWTKRD